LAVFNISSSQDVTADLSVDTVNFTGSYTNTNAVDITGPGTVNMSAGVSVTTTTGSVTLTGIRGTGAEPGFVILQSANADKKAGDWGFFLFNNSADTTSKWAWVFAKNCTHGLIFQGTKATVSADFQFIAGYNVTSGAVGFSNSGTGNIVIDNVAHFKSAKMDVNGGKIYTSTGVSVFPSSIDVAGRGFFEDWNDNSTITDLYWERSFTDHAFAIASGKTITLTRPFIRMHSKDRANEFKPDSGGTITMTDGILMGGSIPLQLTAGSGTLNATNCDVRDGSEVLAGVTETGGTLNTTSCAVTNTFKFEHNNFDLTQYSQTNGTNTTPRTSLNFDHTFSNQAIGVAATANSVRLDADTSISCKLRIRYFISGDTDFMTTEWDAPDRVLSSIGEILPCKVTDWGITSGAKYKKIAHQLTLKNLQEDKTYTYIYEAYGIDDVFFADFTARTFTTTSTSTDPITVGPLSIKVASADIAKILVENKTG